MVAPNPDTPTEESIRDFPVRARTTIQRLTRSLTRAAKLQMQILSLKSQVLLKKILLSAALGTMAFFAAITGLIFTYIFLFKLLTDIAHIPAVWVWLIFAAFHLVVALTLVLFARALWTKSPPRRKQGAHPHPQPAPAAST